MKNSILGFSQRKLMEYGLDIKDAMLLRYFIDFMGTGKMTSIIIDDVCYYWVKYEHLKNDIPILGITSNDGLRKRLKKLENKKILGHYHKLEGGSYSYYSVGENYINLITDNTKESKEKVVESTTSDSTSNTTSSEENKSAKNNKKQTKIDELINNYTKNSELIEALKDFLKMRKAVKKPLTDRALKVILKKLDELAQGDEEKITILEQSIVNCWQSVFKVNNNTPNKKEFNNEDYIE